MTGKNTTATPQTIRSGRLVLSRMYQKITGDAWAHCEQNALSVRTHDRT